MPRQHLNNQTRKVLVRSWPAKVARYLSASQALTCLYDSTTASLKESTFSGSYQMYNFSTQAGHYSYLPDAAYH
jgi:hypothetical protein